MKLKRMFFFLLLTLSFINYAVDDEFKFNIIAQNAAKNIKQIQVLNQFKDDDTCPIANMVYGVTCGRHAFKNSIFGLLALDAKQKNHLVNFNEYTQNLSELTGISQCVFKNINEKIDEFRKEMDEEYAQAGLPIPAHEQTLSIEEVDFVLNHMPDITKKCSLPPLLPDNFAPIYFPPKGIKEFLRGQYGNKFIKALENIQNNKEYRQAILLLVNGHWFNIIVNKENDNLEFFVFDSASNSNRVNDNRVIELIDLIINSKKVLADLEKEKAEFTLINNKLKSYTDLKDLIYEQNNLKNIVNELQEIANKNPFPDIKRRASFLLAKIYFNGGTGVPKNFELVKKYAAMAPIGNTEIKKILAAIELSEKKQKEKIATDKAAKDKLAKIKAAQALQAKQFKNVADTLAKHAPILQQFKLAQQNKNAKQINKLKPQVQKIRAALNKTAVNIQNNQGQTPLMINPRIVPIVYGINKQRAKITANAKDKKGKTVLQYLIQSPYASNINLYKALVFAGSKVTNNDIKAVQNKLKGKPALEPIVKLLKIGQVKNK